jgi:hypothetical protein
MKKVLFVCYGSGHVRMVLPVARALQASGRAQVRILGLTTAAAVVREAGLPLLQVKDFVEPGDEPALAHGDRLAATLPSVVDAEETRAYLGLGYADLEAEVGPEEAARRFAQHGRQAFLPVRLLTRILRMVKPDLVVATNAPRAERAAILAARALQLPAICMVDLFAIAEVAWIGEPGYADRVCVLNGHVRDFLIAAGRRPEEIVVTGNPAFDVLQDRAAATAGARLREARGWQPRRVVLWPAQVEPARHPFDGRAGDPSLPARTLDVLARWTLAQPDAVLCVRAREGQPLSTLPASDRIVATGQDWDLPSLLHAVETVVTLSSTVGLEGRLVGARLVQVTGSVFEDQMPLLRFGLADAAVALEHLPSTLDRVTRESRHAAAGSGAAATPRVLEEVIRLL